MTKRTPRTLLLTVAVLALTGCGGASAPVASPATDHPGAGAAATAGPLTIFAAASLKPAFTALGAAFTAAHPGVRLSFSFAGSQTLVAQVGQGAPADLLATADTTSVAGLGALLVGRPRVFARNRLAIITAPGDPLKITTLADLARPAVKVVLAGPTVPAGRAARTALQAAGVSVHEVSDEADVSAVVTKVRLGEADAGIGYATDVQAARGAVTGVPLAAISNSYPAAVVQASTHRSVATQFLTFLVSQPGQAILASYGFLPPA